MNPAKRRDPRSVSISDRAEAPFLDRPWIGALLLSWAVGVVDSYGYDRYGVFTTNQAGNLVIFAHGTVDGSHRGGLAGLSLAGAITGVVIGVLIQKRVHDKYWLRIAAPTLAGTAVLAVLGVVDILGHTNPRYTIVTVAMGMALIATGVLGTPFVSNWLTGNTGALLSSTAGLTQSGGRWSHMPRSVKSALAITVGFVVGAVSYALFLERSPYALLIGLLPTFVVALLALQLHRRKRKPLE